jgi:VanZ family protein
MRRLSLWAPPVLYAGLIFYLSSRSSFPVPGYVWDFDKVVHFIEYGIFAVLLARATGSPLAAFIIATVYGVTDEFHQSFVPGRDSSGFDAMADAIGSAVAVLAWRALRDRRASRSAPPAAGSASRQ